MAWHRTKRGKFGNIPTVVDNIRFDSRKEANRYCELRNLAKTGQITGFIADKRLLCYPLVVNNVYIAKYEADFSYYEDGQLIIEDVKGAKTREYIMKRRLMVACHNIHIRET